jgi:hypothetical protein
MTGPAANNWVMWEARAAEGRAGELLAWVLEAAGEAAQVYASEDRVVAIHPREGSGLSILSDAPADLITRPAYQWEFQRVR